MHDHIIVGQGIAGTVLALAMLKRGKKIVVIDDDHASRTSLVAAGLVNPVVFKRLSETWKAGELIPEARRFYKEAEKLLGKTFYHDRELLKVFTAEEEKEQWKKAAAGLEQYISAEIIPDYFTDIINNPLGCAEVKQGAYLDTMIFLAAAKEYFISKEVFRQEAFVVDALKVDKDKISYKDITARSIIFCEGHRTTGNPYFSWLPFALTKGEMITVRIKNYSAQKVVNKGIFLLPIGNDLFKAGATYRWNDMNEIPTEDALAELRQKLEKILKVPYEIVDHAAGVRPTVRDRRPLIGLHPQHPAVGIFNGLGSKGVMIAPYFAQQLINHLEGRDSLDPEVDIRRFL
jgi:glycine oxidase